jgi:protein-S-isoprenylcysteine O-methyltransferase Ste14
MNRLFFEAVLAFLAMPGVVAFLIPIAVLAPQDGARFDMSGSFLLVPGIILLLWCVREFYTAGQGTLAPWTPPRHLVVSGLYSHSRNPMYIAVILIIGGWALGFRSTAVVSYALLMIAVFHIRVVFFEEPWLAETHGDTWLAYKARVPRWIGRRRVPNPDVLQAT